MKNLRRKLLVSAFTLLLAVTAVATTTFAWFTMGKETQVGGIDLEVQGDDGLLIRVVEVNGIKDFGGNKDIAEFQSKIDLTKVMEAAKIQLVPLSMSGRLDGGTGTFDLGSMSISGQETVDETQTPEEIAADKVIHDKCRTESVTLVNTFIEENKKVTSEPTNYTMAELIGNDYSGVQDSGTEFVVKAESILGIYNTQTKGGTIDVKGEEKAALIKALQEKGFTTDDTGIQDTQLAALKKLSTDIAGKISTREESLNVNNLKKGVKLDIPTYKKVEASAKQFVEITFEFLATSNVNVLVQELSAKNIGEQGPEFMMPREMELNGITYSKNNAINDARLANSLRVAYVQNSYEMETIKVGDQWNLVKPSLYDQAKDLVSSGHQDKGVTYQFGSWDDTYTQTYPDNLGKAAVKFYNILNNTNVKVPTEYDYDVKTAGDYKTVFVTSTQNADNLTGYKGSATFRIWLEGWDADCFNPLIFDKANFTMKFTTPEK